MKAVKDRTKICSNRLSSCLVMIVRIEMLIRDNQILAYAGATILIILIDTLKMMFSVCRISSILKSDKYS